MAAETRRRLPPIVQPTPPLLMICDTITTFGLFARIPHITVNEFNKYTDMIYEERKKLCEDGSFHVTSFAQSILNSNGIKGFDKGWDEKSIVVRIRVRPAAFCRNAGSVRTI